MINKQMKGTIEVITGPMFAGKTTALLRNVRKANALLFAPRVDTRPKVTHDGYSYEPLMVDTANDILRYVLNIGRAPYSNHVEPRVIAIDEAQFFDENLVQVVDLLALQGHDVILAGLALDSDGLGFGPMPLLLAHATEAVYLSARCEVCGGIATRSRRRPGANVLDPIGGEDKYFPVCPECWFNIVKEERERREKDGNRDHQDGSKGSTTEL